MFLKKLTLHGFKSFADRTVFEFDRGMTSVVGPNGCGKSNVLDAVRWVLGEQSPRMLRGQKMLDVIFAGSRTRKPANFAEVELTFDNSSGFFDCEESEVSVGRVLYASGDSEYRINGKTSRLRDVRELFLDTGVGVNAYSIIEQGRVDMMLRASPAERRELFEEAAGISRYQVRRADAQRKLERTQNNLLRLNDLLDELEKRLRSVKLAAGKARNFREYDTRLRELRSSYALAEYDELQQMQRQLDARARAMSNLLAAKRALLARRDATAAALERERQRFDQQIERAAGESRRVESQLSAMRERIRQCELRAEELRTANERLLGDAEQDQRQADKLAESQREQQAQLEQLEQLEQTHAQQLADLQTQRRTATQALEAARAELERAKQDAFEAARAATLLHNETLNLRQQAQRLASQAESIGKRLEQIAGRRSTAEIEHARLGQRLDELEQSIEQSRAQLEQLECRTAEQEQRAAALAEQLASAKEQRSALTSRLSVLEDLERRHEGIDQAARAVLAWREEPDNPAGIAGLVADLLRIDDPRVGLLEPILSRFEQSIVVQTAHQFLSYAARAEAPAGRVGLLALDRAVASEHGLRYQGAPGVVARSVDWVRCDPAYRALAERLLGCTIIVDSRERALALASEAPAGYAFISLDGLCAEPGGRLTLGAHATHGGLISRKTEIRQIRTRLDEVEAALERVTREHAACQATLSDLRVQRDALLAKLANIQKQHAEAHSARLRSADELERLQREHDVLGGQLRELRESRQQIDTRLQQAARDTSESQATQREHEQRIETLLKRVEQTETAAAELSAQLTAAQVEAGRMGERRAARQQAVAALGQQRRALLARVQQSQQAAEQAEQKAAQIAQELRDCTAQSGELEARSAACQRDIEALMSRRAGLARQMESCGALVRRLHAELEQAEAALNDCRVEQREIAVRRENLIARVREDLDLDLVEMFASHEAVDRDWEAVRTEIETLRTKIARLGNVNMDALSELEELSTRHEHLVTQREDLEASIRQLETLIRDLDEESTRRFLACFEQVRENFQTLFRKLFGGGKADILLEDPEQPLTSGIEIIARPPGKEPQVLSLLSGGEKTMAAVALLFAVFKRKPSPFAILDEVDAALDESNIDRFNNVLLEFLEQSQFIVITHSKRTMQCADVLYGVTMEEPGVSKRVSVQFEDRVDTPHVA